MEDAGEADATKEQEVMEGERREFGNAGQGDRGE